MVNCCVPPPLLLLLLLESLSELGGQHRALSGHVNSLQTYVQAAQLKSSSDVEHLAQCGL